MNIKYCYENCPIAQAAVKVFLNVNSSVFEASTDFRLFTENCFKLCPFKDEHKSIDS